MQGVLGTAGSVSPVWNPLRRRGFVGRTVIIIPREVSIVNGSERHLNVKKDNIVTFYKKGSCVRGPLSSSLNLVHLKGPDIREVGTSEEEKGSTT